MICRYFNKLYEPKIIKYKWDAKYNRHEIGIFSLIQA